MIRSMTGYGEAERDTPVGRLRAEVRTVNHRFFSANVRVAPVLERHEPVIRETLRAELPHGQVNCSIRLERSDGVAAGHLSIDEARARGYVDALRELKDRLELPGEVDVALVSRFGDLFVAGDDARPELDAAPVVELVAAAARATAAMRAEEGARLAADLEARLAAIGAAVERIATAAPGRLVRERDRLRRAVTELLDGVGVDDERMAREIAFLAERWSIDEEVVRLRSHLELFSATIAGPDSEPVGKRLAFLVQEMNRETNTIGAKANDAGIEHEVIGIKDEIERLREQIENVE